MYVLQCTLCARMNVRLGFKKIYHRCSKTILNSTWLFHHLYTTTLQAAPREGWTGDSDLYLCHLPVDLRS
jgi:hypothetical protein